MQEHRSSCRYRRSNPGLSTSSDYHNIISFALHFSNKDQAFEDLYHLRDLGIASEGRNYHCSGYDHFGDVYVGQGCRESRLETLKRENLPLFVRHAGDGLFAVKALDIWP